MRVRRAGRRGVIAGAFAAAPLLVMGIEFDPPTVVDFAGGVVREVVVAPQGILVLDLAGNLAEASNPSNVLATGLKSPAWVAANGLAFGGYHRFYTSGNPFGVYYTAIWEDGIVAGSRVLPISGGSSYRDGSGISSHISWNGGQLLNADGLWGAFANPSGGLHVLAMPDEEATIVPLGVDAIVGPDLSGGHAILWKQAGVLHRADAQGTETGQVADAQDASDLCAGFSGGTAVVLRVRKTPAPRTLSALRWSDGAVEHAELPGAASDSWLANPPLGTRPPMVAAGAQSFAVLVGADWPSGLAAATCSIVEFEPLAVEWARSTPFPSPTGAPSVVYLDPLSSGDPRYAALVPLPDSSSEIRYVSRIDDGTWVSDLVYTTVSEAVIENMRAGRTERGPAVSWVEVGDGGERVGLYSEAQLDGAAVQGWALW